MTTTIWVIAVMIIGYMLHRVQMRKIHRAYANQQRIADQIKETSDKLVKVYNNQLKISEEKDRVFTQVMAVTNQLVDKGLALENSEAQLKTELSNLKVQYERTLAVFN